jgi:hypothetical protein
MKRLFLFLFLGLLAVFTLSAKDQEIVNPAYEFTTSGIFHISKIELGKEELRMHIHAQFIPHWWVKFTKANCFIEDDATGRRWQVMDIRNGELDEKIFMPDSGDSTFVLIFPKPDKSVTKINYIDDDDDDKTGIFGISLNPQTNYLNELHLKPGIVYDVIKVRELNYLFGDYMKDDKNDAQFFLSQQKSHIQDAFLKEEAERLFLKNFPLEKPVAYELPDTKEAKIFKELIAPFKGKILSVDFWATTCGPCVYNSIRTGFERNT